MLRYKIVVKQDTPFAKEGDILSIKEFRSKFGYICTEDVSDEDLIAYIKDYSKYPQTLHLVNSWTSDWFEVMEIPEVYNPPLSFIYEGLLWRKEIDGLYHAYVVGREVSYTNAIPKTVMSIDEVKDIMSKVKFKTLMYYCTEDVNKKA